ncbi:Arf GTPase arf1 [Balamuthia mandrillaris]
MEGLPAEVMERIFSYLDVRSLLRVSCCCSWTQTFAMGLPSLWKAFYAAEFDTEAPPPQDEREVRSSCIAHVRSQALSLRRRWHSLASILRHNTDLPRQTEDGKENEEEEEAAKEGWRLMKEKAVLASTRPPFIRKKQELWEKTPHELRLLVLGLRRAGKSSMFWQLDRDRTCTIPGVGVSMETAHVSNLYFKSLDVDSSRVIPLYRAYFHNVCALIFVVDVSNNDATNLPNYSQLEVAGKRLRQALLHEPSLHTPVLLVFANNNKKKDCFKRRDRFQAKRTATESLALNALPPEILWHVQPCCMINNIGLLEGLSWLVAVFGSFFS